MIDMPQFIIQSRDEALVREYFDRRMKNADDAQKYTELKEWFENKHSVPFDENPPKKKSKSRSREF